MSASIPSIKVCYLKDAAEFRRLNTILFRKNISETRDFIRDKQLQGIDIYLWSDAGQNGYFYLQNPMAQDSWAIIFYESQPISSQLTHRIAEAVFNDFPALYRLDSYSIPDDLPDDGFRICKGQFVNDLAIYGRSFFLPQFSSRQLVFIAWRFGYIALISNEQGDKISRIDFVRQGSDIDSFTRSFVLFYDLFEKDGQTREGLEGPALLDAPLGLPEQYSVLTEAAEQIIAYLKGERQEFTFPYEAEEGTPFQRRVWEVTGNIPYAHLFSYKDIANEIVQDDKKAVQLSRAVGQALGANPLPLCIPCHRVVGKNRDLTGFSGGVDIKDFLLNLEFLKYN